MKLENWMIIFVGFLIFSILFLMVIDAQKVSFDNNLDAINREAILAKAAGDEDKFAMHMSLMQEKLQILASNSLGISVTTLYLEEDYNFPFRDASEVKLRGNQSETIPICDIIPKIPVHLQKIRNTEMFSIFAEKYQKYPIKLIISDERNYISTVHYSIVAKSEDTSYSASTFFHVDSCTDKMEVPYNLSCRDTKNEDFMHTRDQNEIFASLDDDDDFCKIHLEPWKQALYDYSQEISNERKKHFEKLDAIKDLKDNFDAVMEFQNELERLGLLGNLINHAMTSPLEDKEMQEMVQEYAEKFGDLPDEFLKLIENNN